MWYPPSIVTPAAAEPVTLDRAKLHLRVDGTDEDDLISGAISAARRHIEDACGIRLGTQTVTVKCDGFADFAYLSVAPVQSITSIEYVDTAGASQTLATTVYELRADDLIASIALKYGQRWPTIQPRSRITVTAVVGYPEAPDPVTQAMLLLIGHYYTNREAVVTGTSTAELPMAVNALLAPYRMWSF